MIELAIYAIIAMLIVGRLYASLGRGPDIHYPGMNSDTIIDSSADIIEESEDIAEFIAPDQIINASNVMEQMIKYDPNFSFNRFLSGAEKAFEIILKSLNSEDLGTLKNLTDRSLYSILKEKISERSTKHLNYCTTIVCFKKKSIVDIKAISDNVCVTVQFLSQQVSYAEDQRGNVVSGNKTDITTIEDTWTFKRSLKDSSPKWLLAKIH